MQNFRLNNKQFLLPILLLISGGGFCQVKTDTFLLNLITSNASNELKNILHNPDSFRYQLIYTRIDRDKNNKPHLANYYLNVNRNEYFNPASTVKMPVAFLALEKINQLKKFDIDKDTPMLTDSSYSGQSVAYTDSTAENGFPSIAHYIRKIFLVSDNIAYNRLYEFVGQQTINRRLWKMGYDDMRITRRFVTMNPDQNRHTNAIRFMKDRMIYRQPPEYNKDSFDFSKPISIGKAHYNRNDSLINSPMDFTTHNNAPLEDLQQILQSVIFPSSMPSSKRFKLKPEDYRFLYQCISELPSQSKFPRYDTAEFFDSYTKFFLFKAGRSSIPGHIKVFNKTGWSYGFLTDIAYIVDFNNNIEFMLSGVIYVNSDGILNDNKYEYDKTGYPFFKETGNIIYQYELKRKRANIPDLSNFRLNYNK